MPDERKVELAPCPFCGESPLILSSSARCANTACGLHGWALMTHEQWNRRAPSQVSQGEQSVKEAVREAHEVHFHRVWGFAHDRPELCATAYDKKAFGYVLNWMRIYAARSLDLTQIGGRQINGGSTPGVPINSGERPEGGSSVPVPASFLPLSAEQREAVRLAHVLLDKRACVTDDVRTVARAILSLASGGAGQGADGENELRLNPSCRATFDTDNGWQCYCEHKHPLVCAKAAADQSRGERG